MSAVARHLDSIKRHTGLRSREIAELLATTPQTVSRWQQGRVEPQPATLHRLLALEWLSFRLSELFEPSEARLWIYTPHKLIQGRRPADLIAADDTASALALADRPPDREQRVR